MMERVTWWLLIKLIKIYSTKYMDQWEMVKFETEYGTVYVDILRSTPWPDSYDEIK